ncbi:Eukaryotic translation initiation factor 4B [Anthophora retusa]
MSLGKKGKKKKCKTVDLMAFLADGGGTSTVPVKPLSSWIDEMEEEHEGFSSRSSKEPVILPTAPRAARGPRVADEDIPNNPPYVAYLSNLPYEVDEAYLTEFFADMKIANIRLPKDSNKLKGYGYVEFEDRQSLIDALCLSNTPMKTRRVRIDVSNSVNDDRRGGRMGRDNRRDNYDDPERTSGDWRSGPRDENPPEGDSYRSRYDNRDRRDNRDDRESSDYDNKPGAWRESSDRGRPAFRDRGGFRDDDKEKEWFRYDKGSRDREGGDKGSSFGPRRNYGDYDWERKQGRPATDSKPEPRTRPKLQLQPRTKPIEPIAVKEEQQPAAAPPAAATATAAPAPSNVSSTNIFGAAKPVDTTAREREIEERLAKSYAESKSKEEGDSEKRATKEGIWGRRNGEGREEKEKERLTWRSDEDKSRRSEKSAPRSQPAHSEQYGESRGQQPSSRGGPPTSRGPPRASDTRGGDRDRKDKEKDDVSRMPKAKDGQAPNFVASNKYSMLPDDVDPDNIDD